MEGRWEQRRKNCKEQEGHGREKESSGRRKQRSESQQIQEERRLKEEKWVESRMKKEEVNGKRDLRK